MLKKILALILAITVQQFVYCCAADVAITKSYYILKYEYEDFLYPLSAAGASEQELLNFFADVETELKKVPDISKENFEKEMKNAVITVSTFRAHRNVASIIYSCYGNEIDEYLDTNIIPDKLTGVYDALVRTIFGENAADKSELVMAYEKYKKISSSELSKYTDETVNAFNESLKNALIVLKEKDANSDSVAKAKTDIDDAYNALKLKPTDSGGSSGGGGGGGGNDNKTPDTSDKNDQKPVENTDKTDNTNKDNDTGKKTVFSDLPESHWSYKAVSELVDKKVINGFDDSTFRPDTLVTREEFAKMICAAFNLKRVGKNTVYSDADSNEWYYEYIQIITENNVMQGKGDGTFGIGETLSRQDLAVMAKRLVDNNYLNKSYSETDNYTPFSDMNEADDYAKASIEYIKKRGIINGVGDNKYAPKNGVTRAEAAQLIYSLIK